MNLLTIENKAGKLSLSEAVSPSSISRLIDEIAKVFGATKAESGENFGGLTNCIENAADTLEIEIHSPGGSVLDGYKLFHAIYDMRERGVFVTAKINSLAASMASVIAMAADKIQMVTGGRMMIHDVSWTGSGNADSLRDKAELIDEMSEEIAAVYSDRTKLPVDEVRAMMKRETWMGANEAMKLGFVDEVISGKKIDACHSQEQAHTGSMFATQKAWREKVEGLEARVSEIEADATAAAESFATAQAELATANESIAALNTELAELKTTNEILTNDAEEASKLIEAKDKEISEAKAEVETAKASAARVAAEMLASAGHPAPINNVDINAGSGKTVTRAEFDQLSHQARNEYIRAGGKVTA